MKNIICSNEKYMEPYGDHLFNQGFLESSMCSMSISGKMDGICSTNIYCLLEECYLFEEQKGPLFLLFSTSVELESDNVCVSVF